MNKEKTPRETTGKTNLSSIDESKVTYLDAMVEQLSRNISVLDGLVTSKVLPGKRKALFAQLAEARVTVDHMIELLSRSGLGDRLGVISTEDPPVFVQARPVKIEDGTGTQG